MISPHRKTWGGLTTCLEVESQTTPKMMSPKMILLLFSLMVDIWAYNASYSNSTSTFVMINIIWDECVPREPFKKTPGSRQLFPQPAEFFSQKRPFVGCNMGWFHLWWWQCSCDGDVDECEANSSHEIRLCSYSWWWKLGKLKTKELETICFDTAHWSWVMVYLITWVVWLDEGF